MSVAETIIIAESPARFYPRYDADLIPSMHAEWCPTCGLPLRRDLSMGRVTCAAALTALLVGVPVRAEAVTGNELYWWCTAPRKGFCLGYIIGLSEMYTIVELVMRGQEYRFGPPVEPYCRPDGTTNQQLADVVIVYLRDHPERRHQPALVLALDALAIAFPC